MASSRSTMVPMLVLRRPSVTRVVLGPAWRRDRHLESGAEVDDMLEPEGPQRDDLADDIAAALDANPAAGACFDSIAQFYRRPYLRYIDATTRYPDRRAATLGTGVGWRRLTSVRAPWVQASADYSEFSLGRERVRGRRRSIRARRQCRCRQPDRRRHMQVRSVADLIAAHHEDAGPDRQSAGAR